jgi:threonine efflux protein
MSTWTLISSVALVHLLMISSPGPTFLVVSKYALAGDRRSGLLVAVGVVLATLTWSAFAATGLGTVATTYPLAFAAVQYAGAGYLIYLGARLIRDFFAARAAAGQPAMPSAVPAGGWRAVGAGYLTNISNPKVIAYYTSLFGVMLPAEPSTLQFATVVSTVVIVSAAWWVAIACFFTFAPVRNGFAYSRRWIEGVMGVVLVGFGLKLISSR